MLKQILILVLACAGLSASAHPGGHGPDVIPSYTRWTLKDGTVEEGRFLHGHAGGVVVERADGSHVCISLNDLSERDRLRAESRMRYAALLNGQADVPLNRRHGEEPLWMLLALSVAGLVQWGVSAMLTGRVRPGPALLSKLRLAVFVGTFLGVLACRKETASPDDSTPAPAVIPRTRLTFLDSAYAPFKPAVATRSDHTWYYVESNGMPAHGMMVGITSWQQQVPIPQPYSGTNSWSIPLQPVYSAIPLSTRSNLMKGAVAIAVNGVPIFNALNNRGEDSHALGELDQWGGHCGRADDYHYHAAPMHLVGASSHLPIAFGLDGFAVYGAAEPDGSPMAALDTCHGHALGNSIYHYHGTATYPYVIGAMRGKVSLDPATPAPENQILPQAFAKPARPATTPLRGATITDFSSTGPNAYSLTYRIGTRNGYVHYRWDAAGKYTYTLVDTAGTQATNTYQR
jgi:hypothetical protein